MPTKLPDISRYYRMVEGRQLYINSFVNKLPEEMIYKMEQWFEKKQVLKAKKFGLFLQDIFLQIIGYFAMDTVST